MSHRVASSSGRIRIIVLIILVAALTAGVLFWPRGMLTTGLGVSRVAVITLLQPYQFSAAPPVDGQERWVGIKKDSQVDLIGPADDLRKIALMFRLSGNSADNTLYLGDMAQTLHLVLPRWTEDPGRWLNDALPLARNGQGQVTSFGNIRIDAFVLDNVFFLNLMPMQQG